MPKGNNTVTETKPSEINNQPNNLQPQEAMYSVDELMAASRLRFGVAPEVVGAAMKFYEVPKATQAEAKKLIEKFKKREVN